MRQNVGVSAVDFNDLFAIINTVYNIVFRIGTSAASEVAVIFSWNTKGSKGVDWTMSLIPTGAPWNHITLEGAQPKLLVEILVTMLESHFILTPNFSSNREVSGNELSGRIVLRIHQST